MNYVGVLHAGLGGFVAYCVGGGLLFGPRSLAAQFMRFPTHGRGIENVPPAGVLSVLIGLIALAYIYALAYRGGSDWIAGARFGAAVGIFVVGAFTVHLYTNFGMEPGLALKYSVEYFAEWVFAGIAMGLTYRPLPE